MYEINDIITLNIVDITEDGRGIGKTDKNFTVFVDSSLPGDKVEAKIYRKKKNFAEANLVEVIEYSENRQTSLCPTDADCGGCDFSEYKYESQLNLKQLKVENLIKKLSDIDIDVNYIISTENILNYRNKAVLHIKNDSSIGYYSKKSHNIINMKNCLINSTISIDIKNYVSELLKKHKIDFLKDIVVRNNRDNSEVLVGLVSSKKDDNSVNKAFKLSQDLSEKFVSIKSIVLNINEKNKSLFGKENLVFTGEGFIYDNIKDYKFKISMNTFFQINPEITEKMYNKVLEYCDLTGNEIVYDIYSGIGTISLFLARKAKEVIGIEIVKDSVENAVDNAKLNGVGNVSFEYGKAEEILPRHSSLKKHADIIVVDPPRKGCERQVIDAMIQIKPKKIVYVSCNPATLARDLSLLASDYTVKKVQPFDMFPLTNHVETVVLLQKVNS